MKKILVMANVASMIAQFNMRNLDILLNIGYRIEVACNFMEGNTCSDDVLIELKNKLEFMGILYHQIDFSRGLSNVHGQIKSFTQVNKLMKERQYDVVFVQSTIAGIAARHFGKKYGCKIIYIAHGFQFYEGASWLRWSIFYNLERYLSKKTDTLILTNRDDYNLAKKNFHSNEILFVPGVGVDIDAFKINEPFNTIEIRKKWKLASDDYVIFSAGELSNRKNHRIVMEAIREINNPKIKYLICGIGPLEDEYRKLVKEWKMEENIFFLGYQMDLKSIYGISDLFILPSINEGLPVCLLMSIASNVVSACSDIRGNHELVRNSNYLFDPDDKEGIKQVIQYVMNHPKENATTIRENYKNLQKYSSVNVDAQMKDIFRKYC